MEDKVQTGLRIPQSRYEELVQMAERSGVSVNTMVLMLADIGLDVIRTGQEGWIRVLARRTGDNA